MPGGRGGQGAFEAPEACYNVYTQMRFEWDERKNHENQRKHRISFDLAVLVFADEHRLIGLDRVDETGEQRWHAIGAISTAPGEGLIGGGRSCLSGE